MRQSIDRLLEFFSCPMPALESLEKQEQRRQMEKIIQKQSNGVDYSAMLAHCSSFKELQFVALKKIEKRLEKSGRS
jgi:hypothetical protein